MIRVHPEMEKPGGLPGSWNVWCLNRASRWPVCSLSLSRHMPGTNAWNGMH